MSTGKKVLNVFGIIFAIPINTILIILLIIAPLLFSLISFAQPENLVNTVTKVDMNTVISEAIVTPEGETVPQEMEQIGELLKTDAAKELMEVYATDITNALYGNTAEMGFTSEKFMEIVDANIDELAEVFKESDPQMAQLPAEELKTQVRDMLNETADQVVSALPAPEEIKTEIAGDSEEMNAALEILSKLDIIKWALVGLIVVLSGLVFVLRLYKFRGFCWLSVDLMAASVLSGIMSVALLRAPALLTDMAEGNQVLSDIIGTVASGFATGMLIRTVIMLVCGAGMLVAFIFIRKAMKAKAAPVVIPAAVTNAQDGTPAEEVAEEEAPALKEE